MVFATDDDYKAQFVVVVVIFVLGVVAIVNEEGAENGVGPVNNRTVRDPTFMLMLSVFLSQMFLMVGLVAAFSTSDLTGWLVAAVLLALVMLLFIVAVPLAESVEDLRMDVLEIGMILAIVTTGVYMVAVLVLAGEYTWLLSFLWVFLYATQTFESLPQVRDQNAPDDGTAERQRRSSAQ